MLERWSLARRLTRLFLGTTLVFIAGISLASGVFLWSAIAKEVDALANEEIEEAPAAFKFAAFDLDAFRRATEVEQRRHPDNPMAWRVWPAGASGPHVDIGHVALLPAEWPDVSTKALQLEHTRRSRTLQLGSGVLLGLVMDGSVQYRQLGLYAIVVAALVAATFALTLLVSRRFFNQVSALLYTVAERLRASGARTNASELEIEGSPEEIREVAVALSETLTKIRAESEHARVFTAGLAHELRSPVQNLIGETEVALISNREPTVYRAVLNSNLDELRRLGDAIDNLVTICSFTETRGTVAREDFDLTSEIELRLLRERALAERSGLVFELETHGDTTLRGDREAVLRAVRNLTQNAMQWSPPNGRVTVAIDGREDEITVRVDDEGPGVPDELRDVIFEPFHRGPQARGRRVGYGLGLALARSAMTEHGGRVEVGTSAAGGARFTLHMPRTNAPVAN